MLRLGIVTLAILASTGAFAQGADGGPAPLRCGDTLSDDGACYGSVAAWCKEPNANGVNPDAGVTTLDCAALELDDEEVGGTCAVLGEVGAWCGVSSGAPCALPASDGVVQLACLAAGVLDDNAACDLDLGCVPGASCSSDVPVCEGDLLRLSCSDFGQALVVTCPAGSVCGDGACTGVPEGQRCGERLLCADELLCIGAEEGLGTCLPEGAPVTPVPPPDEDPPPPPAGCSANHAGGSSTSFGWLALLSLVAVPLSRSARSLG